MVSHRADLIIKQGGDAIATAEADEEPEEEEYYEDEYCENKYYEDERENGNREEERK